VHTAGVARILFLIGSVRCLIRLACRRGASGERQDGEERGSGSPTRGGPSPHRHRSRPAAPETGDRAHRRVDLAARHFPSGNACARARSTRGAAQDQGV